MKRFSLIFFLSILLINTACTTPPAPAATITPEPTATQTIQPTKTIIPTSTPLGGYPQIYVGFAPGALRVNGCGGRTFITEDHDPEKDQALSFWGKYNDIPKPKYSFGTKDGRRILDVCTYVGYEIWWAMEEGKVTESRPGVLTILITKGMGYGYQLTIQHCSIQEGITVGKIVKYGDPIAITARELNPPLSVTTASPTAIGVFGKESGYDPDQEMMTIGFDGQPNILYEKKY